MGNTSQKSGGRKMREASNERDKGAEKSAVSEQKGSTVRGRLTEVERKTNKTVARNIIKSTG
ncbi:hypothetical protein FH972_012347 [Carpinus fangiana]|uniref:Uncharacterized protein n=1 Tax=Carpinus fangiana TaxID=176857 RepID=A0A5N6R3J6_9ROSI|nr:hypothetical protein FH972_012347 [Carpinus fangiana]